MLNPQKLPYTRPTSYYLFVTSSQFAPQLDIPTAVCAVFYDDLYLKIDDKVGRPLVCLLAW